MHHLKDESPVMGFLDALGEATATFSIPANSDPALLGLEFHHAYVIWDLVDGALNSSNSESVLLVL